MYWLLSVVLLLSPQIIDRLAAVVEGQPITLSDVNAAMAFHLVDVPPNVPNRAEAVLQKLIDRSLMLREVNRFQPPEPAPVEVTSRIDAIQTQAGSAAALERQLDVLGMTMDQLRRFVRDDLRISTYLNQRFGDSPERAQAVAAWIGELRHRSEITIQYHGS